MIIEAPTFSDQEAQPAKLLAPEALEAHLRLMQEDTVLVPLERLLAEQPIGCMDGRKTGCIVGAPGGNAGLFVLMLAAYEAHTRLCLRDDFVEVLFDHYLRRFGQFYLHTDAHALEQLRKAIAKDDRLRPHARYPLSLLEANTLACTPLAEAQKALLELLLRPEHIGCGHLRLLLEHPEEYNVRQALVEAILCAFFHALWRGDERLVFEVLRGDHHEQAVINVYAERVERPGHEVPLTMTCPHYDELEIFVHHPEAVAYLHAEHALFLARCGLIQLDNIVDFIQTQQQLSERQLQAILSHLTADLPIYDVVAGAEGFNGRLKSTRGYRDDDEHGSN